MSDSSLPPFLRLQPSAGWRLLWWFGIYFAAQVPLIRYAGYFLFFPMGLFPPYLSLLLPNENRGSDLMRFALDFGFLFYGIHLLFTLCLPSARAFRTLRIILIVAVILNLGGCTIALHGG